MKDQMRVSAWLAVETEVADALTKRRRLSEKTTVRRLKMNDEESSENEEKKQVKFRREFTKVVEEEMQHMLNDDAELATEEIEILAQLKKALDAGEAREEDEVLQTKIISPQEVSRKWSEWLEAVDAEVSSLLEEKEAMEEVSGKKLEEILKGSRTDGSHGGVSTVKARLHQKARKERRKAEGEVGHLRKL